MHKTALTLFILFLSAITSVAHARVDIIPRMVVIENRERSSEVTVLNLSDQTHSYTLETIHYRLNTDGNYTPLAEPLSPLFNPDDVLRMSPKSFTLEQRGKQKVRLSLRRPADLPDGEYRFHLKTIADKKETENQGETGRVSIGISVNVGISIPVIVRQGELNVTGKLENIILHSPSETKSQKPEVSFKIDRTGTASILGRVDVAWRPQGGEWRDIGFVTNFNVFTEINERFGTIALEEMPTGSGELRLTLTDTHNGTLYDEIVLAK